MQAPVGAPGGRAGFEWRPLFDGTGGAAGAPVCSSVATMGVSVGYCLSSFWAARRGAGPSDVGVREALLELCCSSVPFEAPRMMLAAGWVQMSGCNCGAPMEFAAWPCLAIALAGRASSGLPTMRWPHKRAQWQLRLPQLLMCRQGVHQSAPRAARVART